jgi:hypothetical protein
MDLETCLELSRKNLRQLRSDFANAQAVNDELLLGLVRDNEGTEFGRKLGFDAISSVAEFKRAVPLSTYGDYEPYVQRMLAGESDLITTYPIAHYARTSGSVGVPKSIPVSERGFNSLMSFDMPISLAVFDEWAREHGSALDTDGDWTSLVLARLDQLECGVSAGSLSSGMYTHMANGNFFDWGIPAFCVQAGDERANWIFLKALFSLKNRNITCIDGIFSTAVYDFFFYIRRHTEPLLEAIRTGVVPDEVEMTEGVRRLVEERLAPDPERADELAAVFEEGFGTPVAQRIWPRLQFVICICTAAFASYAEKLKDYIGDLPVYGRAYAASESLVGGAAKMNDDGHYLVPRAAFFEFVPADDSGLPEEELRERTLGISELEVGQDYEVIVTNLSGFYRYRLGDVITVLGHEGQSPKIRFKYRLSQVVNMAGEKTSMACVDDAIAKLERTQALPVPEYSVYADYEAEPGRYVLLMEPGIPVPKCDVEPIAAFLERCLEQNNPSYKAKVEDEVLLPLEVRLVQPDTYRLYREMQIFKGASASQIKPVRMIDNPAKERFFLGLVEKEA